MHMGNIVTYLKDEQRTFDEAPLNEVDSLILSSVSYFNFEYAKTTLSIAEDDTEIAKHIDLAPVDSKRVKLHDILCLCDNETLIHNSWLEYSKEATSEFIQELRGSRRYRDLLCTAYINECSDVIEKQFSAVTFIHEGKKPFIYVAFRGTDGTFSGWKEDFNLSYKNIIPSQRTALNYLSGASLINGGEIYVGGHSKGGNLATYASACTEQNLFERITKVFNHDGPSFKNSPSPRVDAEKYLLKYSKTVPESSIIGMILEDDDHYTVVQSTEHSVFQHNPFSWIVEGNEFVKQESINPSAEFFDSALAEWINSKTDEERERFIDSAYAVLASSGHDKFCDFQENLPSNVATILKTGLMTDKQTRKFIFKMIGDFAGVIKDESMSRLAEASPIAKITNERED